jgi:hypothetical protein
MNFIQRYNRGEAIQVYSDIHALGQAAFNEQYFDDVQEVISETMRRTARNLDVIYHELTTLSYNFTRKAKYSFHKPLVRPFTDTTTLLARLDEAVAPFGYVPLSLKLFYTFVGGCNFAWNKDADDAILWPYADPVQIIPLDDLVMQVTNNDWKEEMAELSEYGEVPSLALSADYYHKDNVSGGPAYALALSQLPSVDGRFLNEEHETTLINYLRIVCMNGGFGRIEDAQRIGSFREFHDKVKPKLTMI